MNVLRIRLNNSIFYSCLFHLALFLVLILVSYNNKNYNTKNNLISLNTVEVEMVNLNKIQQKVQTSRQIVQTSKVEKSKDTTSDAFLGEQTQKVLRQTKASVTANFFESTNLKSGVQNSEKENQENKTKEKNQKDIDFKNIALRKDYRPMGNLGPNVKIKSGGALSSTNDYLNDIKEGAQTLLNTREFAYYSFYNRVRKQLEQFWEPNLKNKIEKMLERGRTIASDKEHSTKLLVVLDDEGVIRKILVENTSGYVDLDQAAVEAFNKAGPFPNPPKGLIEKDGTVKVEWEFVLRT
jgi:protein TonB